MKPAKQWRDEVLTRAKRPNSPLPGAVKAYASDIEAYTILVQRDALEAAAAICDKVDSAIADPPLGSSPPASGR